jgi:hypothetical protein
MPAVNAVETIKEATINRVSLTEMRCNNLFFFFKCVSLHTPSIVRKSVVMNRV